ncbi:MAG: sugar phosphate isomerase/epimerase family protein [Armatimonadota bacterium]
MMKLSFMTFATPDWDLSRILTAAIRYGYDGIEPRAEAEHKHGIELGTTKKQRKELKAMFEDTGVANLCLATSRTYSMLEADKRAESVELTKKYIDLAHDTGAPTIRVFGGGTPEGADFAEVKKYVAEALRECAEHAQGSGVYVCFETHDGYISAHDAAEVVRLADSPQAAINWDFMHPCTAGMTIPEAFEVLKPYLRHCHLHDGVRTENGGWDLVLMGKGQIDHQEAIRLLGTIGYEGALSGEWIAFRPAEELLPHEAAVLREYRAAAGG